MRIRVLSIGHKPPTWAKEAVAHFSQRLPQHWHFELLALPPLKTGKQANKQQETQYLLRHVKANETVVALDERGKALTSRDLAHHLERYSEQGQSLCLLIGGASGLDHACLAANTVTWSLSKLTLPHMLVRVVLVEQLYRAWSLLNHHPYHRA